MFLQKQDRFFKVLLVLVASLYSFIFLLSFGYVLLIVFNTFKSISPYDFMNTDWNINKESFGALSFIFGSFYTSVIAVLISLPCALAINYIYFTYLNKFQKMALFYILQLSASIPTIVLGLWGVELLVPFLKNNFQPFLQGFFPMSPLFAGPPLGLSMMAAIFILTVMSVPTLALLFNLSFRMQKNNTTDACMSLGMTSTEKFYFSYLNSSWSVIFSAIIICLGRCIGETIAVSMVIGNTPNITFSLFEPGQTLTSLLVNEFGEASSELHLIALTGVAAFLFFSSLIIHLVAKFINKSLISKSEVDSI